METVPCPFCGEGNKEGVSVCKFCNKLIGELPALSRCHSCGEIIKNKEKGCPTCGKKADTTGLVLSIAIVVAIGIVGGACYLAYYLFTR